MEGRVPLTALRLVNPPGRKRRKPFPAYSSAGPKKTKRRNPVAQTSQRKVLKRKKMGNGGYRWFYGGKLVSATKAKRVKSARTNPRTATGQRTVATVKTKQTRTRRKPATIRATRPIQTRTRTVAAPRPKRSVRAIARPVRNPRRKKRVSEATRKRISAALRRYHRGTKRASNPPKKRRMAVAKKTTRRKPTRRRTTSRVRKVARRTSSKPRYGTRAYYSWLGRQGALARKRGGKRKRVRRNPATHTKVSTRYSKKRYTLPRGRFGAARKPVAHRVKRTGWRSPTTNAHSYRYAVVKRNPGLKDIGGLVKKVLPIYGGMIAARAISVLVNTHVVRKYITGGLTPMISAANAKYANMAAPGLTFLLSVFAGPALFKGGGTGKQILEGLQLGSLVATFDSMLSAFLPMEAKQYIGLTGYDDMGVLGYGYGRGMGAYMADPTGYSLPPAYASLEPGMGLDVHEAMALDSYVTDDGLGLSVEEALADSESDYMQRGGAGGSLSRTLFTY